MNFLINRAELIAVTGLGRTHTFALQKSGKLQTASNLTSTSWFELHHVLKCVAAIHQLPDPDDVSVSLHASLVVDLRSKKALKRNK